MKSADYHQVPWVDLRRRRAEQLTAMVMNLVEPFIRNDDEYDLRREASRKLLEFFHTLGVEVITDFERTAAGLPLRNTQGYSEEEMRLLETHRRAVMYQNIPINVPMPTVLK